MGICTKSLKYSLEQNRQGSLSVKLNKLPAYLGYASSRVNRFYNEDRLSLSLLKVLSSSKQKSTPESKQFEVPVLNLNIFDGHGGDYIVDQLEKRLSSSFADCQPSKEKFFTLLKEYEDIFSNNDGMNYWKKLYKKRNKYFEQYIMNCSSKKENLLYNGARMIFDKNGNIIDKTALLTDINRLRIYQTFLGLDLQLYKEKIKEGVPEDKITSGSTASSLFLAPLSEEDLSEYEGKSDVFWINNDKLMRLYAAQLGDCKILLCDKEGVAHSLTLPHHPNTNKFENKRLSTQQNTDTNKTSTKKIKDTMDDELVGKDAFGEERFLNTFANTRSFGDYIGKPFGLTAEPDIYSYLIGSTRNIPHSEKHKLQFGGDECFVIMMTDGVSNLLTDQEVVDLVTTTVNLRGIKKANPQFVCDEIIKYILAIGGKQADNASCIILRLSNWGNWPDIDRTGKTREEKLMNNDEMRE
ncbi:hypothetical protein QEN19_000988 [Hanseniaspora menglaensis]